MNFFPVTLKLIYGLTLYCATLPPLPPDEIFPVPALKQIQAVRDPEPICMNSTQQEQVCQQSPVANGLIQSEPKPGEEAIVVIILIIKCLHMLIEFLCKRK